MPKTRILVAPLDWGLGHATRCIPLLKVLAAKGAYPVMASGGTALALLRREFPELPFIRLPAYGVRYPGGRNMAAGIALQLPHIWRTAFREHRLLQHIIEKHRIQGVISDNRFGCFSSRVPCVYMTHQLHLRIPLTGFEGVVRRMNYRLIRRYDICWIPDFPDPPGLAGDLSHPAPSPHYRYIGPLSRLEPGGEPAADAYDVVFLLSGPEPQRSILEQQLLKQADRLTGTMLLVQGLPASGESPRRSGRVVIVPYLGSAALGQVLSACRLVVCRSGYSTVMDLARLEKKAVFIPTPGQTEQEYLAGQLQSAGYCFFQPQSALDLVKATAQASLYPGLKGLFHREENLLETAVEEFLQKTARVSY